MTPQLEVIFHLIDGSTFHAVEHIWITDQGPEKVRVRGWFESELTDPWLGPPAPKHLFIHGQSIVWWQESDQLEGQA